MKVLAAGNARVRTLGAGPDTSPAQAVVVEGGDPETYASIAALVTASEGGLAAGYYQVTAGVPVTHPQYPRVLTYWDGATFEPQISTGFESRPSLAGEIFCWDALESAYRYSTINDIQFVELPDMLDGLAASCLSAPVNRNNMPWWRSSELSFEVGSHTTYLQRFDGTIGYNTGTICLAGTDFGAASIAFNQVLAGCGSTAGNAGISIFNYASGVSRWNIGWWSLSDTSAVAPRAEGDVVILSWDATSYDLWVNGAKILTRTTGMLLSIAQRLLTVAGADGHGYDTHGVKFSFVDYSTTRLDATAAATWTTWLQARYSIPPL